MRVILSRLLVIAALAGATACGNVVAGAPDSGPGLPDAGLPAPDARPPLLPPAETAELNAAAGHASGGSYGLDFQVGHALPQRPAAGDTRAVDPSTSIKP